jgi:hypothetical protein
MSWPKWFFSMLTSLRNLQTSPPVAANTHVVFPLFKSLLFSQGPNVGRPLQMASADASARTNC